MMIINKTCIRSNICLSIIICFIVQQTVQGMDHHDMRQTSSLIPLAIGTVCIASAVGIYYFHKAKRQACNLAAIIPTDTTSTVILGDEKDGGEERVIKIKYRDKKHTERSLKYTLTLSPEIIQAFTILQQKAKTEKIVFEAIQEDHFNDNPTLTLTLIQKLFNEAQTDNLNQVLIKNAREYNFFMSLVSTCGASDEIKKKIALKYAVPQMEALLKHPNTDINYTSTIDMIQLLPDADKVKLEDRLYGLRFQTKEFKQIKTTMDKLSQVTGNFVQGYCDTIHNGHYDCNGKQIESIHNAVYWLDCDSVYEILPTFAAHSSVKAWYQSFEYQLYVALCSCKPNTITCLEYTKLKRWYARSFVRVEKRTGGDVNIFKCKHCEKESILPCKSVDPQTIIACKACMAEALNGRTVDLTDCYYLDRVSLHRLIHRAYRYKGFYNSIREEDSEAYEDIHHGNRLHLPLLQLLIKYYGINYTEMEGTNSSRAHLRLGLRSVLLDAADIEVLPTFRRGDRPMYDCIECIVQYENDINELLTTTRKLLPNIHQLVTIVYRGEKEQYHLYEDKIALELTAIRAKLAEYFFLKGNWSGSNKNKAKEKRENDPVIAQCIKKLKEIATLYNIDYNKELKHEWGKWWSDGKRACFYSDARIIVTVPIRHAPIELGSEKDISSSKS